MMKRDQVIKSSLRECVRSTVFMNTVDKNILFTNLNSSISLVNDIETVNRKYSEMFQLQDFATILLDNVQRNGSLKRIKLDKVVATLKVIDIIEEANKVLYEILYRGSIKHECLYKLIGRIESFNYSYGKDSDLKKLSRYYLKIIVIINNSSDKKIAISFNNKVLFKMYDNIDELDTRKEITSKNIKHEKAYDSLVSFGTKFKEKYSKYSPIENTFIDCNTNIRNNNYKLNVTKMFRIVTKDISDKNFLFNNSYCIFTLNKHDLLTYWNYRPLKIEILDNDKLILNGDTLELDLLINKIYSRFKKDNNICKFSVIVSLMNIIFIKNKVLLDPVMENNSIINKLHKLLRVLILIFMKEKGLGIYVLNYKYTICKLSKLVFCNYYNIESKIDSDIVNKHKKLELITINDYLKIKRNNHKKNNINEKYVKTFGYHNLSIDLNNIF